MDHDQKGPGLPSLHAEVSVAKRTFGDLEGDSTKLLLAWQQDLDAYGGYVEQAGVCPIILASVNVSPSISRALRAPAGSRRLARFAAGRQPPQRARVAPRRPAWLFSTTRPAFGPRGATRGASLAGGGGRARPLTLGGGKCWSWAGGMERRPVRGSRHWPAVRWACPSARPLNTPQTEVLQWRLARRESERQLQVDVNVPQPCELQGYLLRAFLRLNYEAFANQPIEHHFNCGVA
jgi:hypothetical protein